MTDIRSYIKKRQDIVNSELRKVLPKDSSLLSRAMRYSALSKGKRLRAILVMASAAAVGGNEKKVLSIACAVELIHAFSLVHDDLPSMDNDRLRRGMPTAHIKFDEATAILAADALFALAYEVLGNTRNIDPEIMLEIMRNLSSAIGGKGMCSGQSLDIQNEGKKISFEKLKEIHGKKTGELIMACVYCGAKASGANDSEITALLRFAQKIGLSFQIKDDILDVVGSKKLLGKTPGSDKRKQKATYPAILGIKGSKKVLDKEYRAAIASIRGLGKKAGSLRNIAEYVVWRDR